MLGIISPIKKNNYDVVIETKKYFDSIINNTNYNISLLKSQIYFDNIYNDKLFDFLKIYKITDLINFINSCQIFREIFNNEQQKVFDKIFIEIINDNNIYELICDSKFNELKKIVTYINSVKFIKFILDYLSNKIDIHNIHSKSFDNIYELYIYLRNNNIEISYSNIIKKLDIKLLCKIKSHNLEVDEFTGIKEQLNYMYNYYTFFINTHQYGKPLQEEKKYNIKILKTRELLEKKYYITMEKCCNSIDYNNIDNINFLVKALSVYNLTKNIFKLNTTILINYFQTCLKNMSNNLNDIIYVILKYLGETENILTIIENRIKNSILSYNYIKATEFITYLINVNKNIILNGYTYDFKKNIEKIIIGYNFEKFKDKFNKKMLIFEKDTIVNKYEIDDIYKNENENITKIIKQFDDNKYISKNNSCLLIEITKDNKPITIKVNLNEYMILDSVLNNIITDLDTIRKGYGIENVNRLKTQDLISVEGNIVKALCS